MKLLKNLKKLGFLWKAGGEALHLLGISSLILLSDQLFKRSIDAEPQENFPREMPKTKGKVQIMRAHNPGFSKGRLKEYPEFVKLSSLAGASFLAGMLSLLSAAFPGEFLVRKSGMALVIGGAMSNVIDRARKGAVTDYINIRLGALKKSIVNIGDLAIYLGGFLFILASYCSLFRSLLSKEKE